MQKNQFNNRRSFLKSSAMLAGAMALSEFSQANPEPEKPKIPLRNEVNSSYLAFYDPADGHVPNPGMGVSGYLHSDHMYSAYTNEDVARARKLPPLQLDRKTFNQFMDLPYVDNVYLRYEWKDVQKVKGKLDLPESWKWAMEAIEKKGKRWSFRIMNSQKGSVAENSLPDFLQGKLKMVKYWNDEGTRGPNPKYFADYTDEYLNYWDELNMLLGEKFDGHPLLEYVDVSGYGFWGEFHNIAMYEPGSAQSNYIPANVEFVVERLIRDHLRAYPTTPAVLNIHAFEFRAGLDAFEKGLCWPRRDSFRYGFSPTEVQIAHGLTPGSAMVWEIIRPGIYCPVDSEDVSGKLYPIPQRYFDISAHYVAMGFNAWDAIWAHENCKKTYQLIESQIGYRIRPAIVWRRKMHGNTELVLGLRNDGCVAPPGTITIEVIYPNAKNASLELPKGEPVPGKMFLAALPWLNDNENDPENFLEIKMTIQMKGKSLPVQWAVKDWQANDKYKLSVPVRNYNF